MTPETASQIHEKTAKLPKEKYISAEKDNKLLLTSLD